MDERVERESQTADDVWGGHHPLLGLWGGDDLSLGRKPMSDFLGQVPGLPELHDVLLLDGGGHPLASCSGSGHDWSAFLGGEGKSLGVGAREWMGGGRRRRGCEKVNPYPLIKAVKVMRLPARLKTRLFPKRHANDTVVLPMPVLMRIP